MARPQKTGLDYFPLDTTFDTKTELFIAETGAEGLGVLVVCWQIIYDEKGYFAEFNEEFLLVIRRRVLLDLTKINQIIISAIERGVFDKGQFEENRILTSFVIQNTYFTATKKRKKGLFVENYLCEGVKAELTWVNVGKNPPKKSKVKESKGKKNILSKTENDQTHLPVDKSVDNFEVKSNSASLISQAEIVFEFLNNKTGKKFRCRSPNGKPSANGELLIARLKDGYTIQQIKTTVAKKWHEWRQDETMSKYLRPATLFAKKNFENYYGECVIPEAENFEIEMPENLDGEL